MFIEEEPTKVQANLPAAYDSGNINGGNNQEDDTHIAVVGREAAV